jgi:hypothetical protein
MKRYIFLALAALLAPAAAETTGIVPSTAANGFGANSVWMQLGPGGIAEIRAAAHVCPQVVFDQIAGQPPRPRISMGLRAAADDKFPSVCSLALPAGTKRVQIVEHQENPNVDIWSELPVPVADPKRILVLGDTGCRIKGSAVQACNDPVAWPFAGLAYAAANLKPDLIIHLGDYLYRESPCPAGNAGCAGSPYGDNWEAWNADFFAPAGPLLAAAPWIVIRGNHEDCYRAGPGFLRLLGPVAYDPVALCTDHLDPYAVTAGSQLIAIVDSATASDTALDDKTVAFYEKDFEALKAMANVGTGRELWFATHRPIWAAISGPLGLPIGGSINLIQATGDLSAFGAISLMLSGHIHSFEAINYAGGKVPPQIVAGHGGDNLDQTPDNLFGTIFQGHSGVSVKDGLSVHGFGFLTMARDAKGWAIQLYDSAGVKEVLCRFESGRVFCPKPGRAVH